MLTWAMVMHAKWSKQEWETAVPYVIAMICDAVIFYHIASAIAGKAL
jgi:hypothetical protein